MSNQISRLARNTLSLVVVTILLFAFQSNYSSRVAAYTDAGKIANSVTIYRAGP